MSGLVTVKLAALVLGLLLAGGFVLRLRSYSRLRKEKQALEASLKERVKKEVAKAELREKYGEQVRAIDAAGTADAVPADRMFHGKRVSGSFKDRGSGGAEG